MKQRYTHMRPYGKWLAEQTVTLEDIVSSVPEAQRVPPAIPGVAVAGSNGALGNGNGAAVANGNGASGAGLLSLLKPLKVRAK